MTKKDRAWVYNPRPRGFGPATYGLGIAQLRKLVTCCEQGEDKTYRLPGTTFRMTLTDKANLRIWG